MGTHMKTTVEIADALLREAKALAERERTTLRALFEEGLRTILRRKRRSDAFRLRKASFKGRGVRPEHAPGNWDRIRDAIYAGRGG